MEVDVANIEEDEADDLSNMLADVSTTLRWRWQNYEGGGDRVMEV